VRSTFFVIGSKLVGREARAYAERAHAEGHWIGNHTWTHSRPLGENPGAAAAELEIARTQAEIGKLSHPDRLFRPTGGGGHLDRRLLSPEAAALLELEATPACCGTRCRATGRIRRAGSRPRSRNSRDSPGR
jgi:peptidoglycan-N-acetylglucosamine deacetylase